MHDSGCAIGLVKNWPVNPVGELITWAASYTQAAEILHNSILGQTGTPFYAGPTIQNVGIATELTLKALIKGGGASDRHLRSYSHNTYRAYVDACAHFDEAAFINFVIRNTSHIKTPDEVVKQLMSAGETNPHVRWRVYFDHLRVMDTVYDRPYRSRYITEGSIVLPDSAIVLTGTKTLLAAMQTRYATVR